MKIRNSMQICDFRSLMPVLGMCVYFLRQMCSTVGIFWYHLSCIFRYCFLIPLLLKHVQ